MKKRRTREDKIKTAYRIDLKKVSNKIEDAKKMELGTVQTKHMATDLTRVLALTMLALALELLLYLRLK